MSPAVAHTMKAGMDTTVINRNLAQISCTHVREDTWNVLFKGANSKASTLRSQSTISKSRNDMDTFATHEHVEGQRLTGLAGRGIDRSVSVKSGLTKRHGVSAGYRD